MIHWAVDPFFFFVTRLQKLQLLLHEQNRHIYLFIYDLFPPIGVYTGNLVTM